ncbi:MAG: hypothetical protein AB7O52_05640 [Planctomycetota bacterium]
MKCLVFLSVVLIPVAPGAYAQSPPQVSISDEAGVVGNVVIARVMILNTGTMGVQAWSLGVDVPAAIVIQDLAFGVDALTAHCGDVPDLLALQTLPNGFTMGAIVDIFGVCQLQPGMREIAVAALVPSAAGTYDLCLTNTLGTPPVPTLVTIDGQSVAPTLLCGTLVAVDLVPFVRGDCNGDGGFSISDAFSIFEAVFPSVPGFAPSCGDSCDANDDATIDLSDAVTVLNSLFAGGPVPSSPFPVCGTDPSEPDGLSCASLSQCP